MNPLQALRANFVFTYGLVFVPGLVYYPWTTASEKYWSIS